MNLAIAGRLRARGVLDAQVRRMVADSRADAMISASPASRWLPQPGQGHADLLLFPDFDNVRQALRRDQELLFTAIIATAALIC